MIAQQNAKDTLETRSSQLANGSPKWRLRITAQPSFASQSLECQRRATCRKHRADQSRCKVSIRTHKQCKTKLMQLTQPIALAIASCSSSDVSKRPGTSRDSVMPRSRDVTSDVASATCDLDRLSSRPSHCIAATPLTPQKGPTQGRRAFKATIQLHLIARYAMSVFGQNSQIHLHWLSSFIGDNFRV